MVVIVSFLSPSFVLAAPTDDVVAVAASMHECINELATQFENHGLGTPPKIVSGASGKLASVSYTHLDVYKRQICNSIAYVQIIKAFRLDRYFCSKYVVRKRNAVDKPGMS